MRFERNPRKSYSSKICRYTVAQWHGQNTNIAQPVGVVVSGQDGVGVSGQDGVGVAGQDGVGHSMGE